MSQELKAKLYDVQEELKLVQEELKLEQDVVQSYSHYFMKIANLLNVEPNEQGVIDLKNIVKAVTVLTSDAMV